MTVRSYEYKGKAWLALSAILFFAPLAYVALREAVRAEHGATLLYAVRLDPAAAVYFYWVAGFGSLLFVVLGLVGLFQWCRPAKYLRLGEHVVEVPTGFSGKAVEIPFSDIRSLSIRKRQFQRWLEIEHSTGQVAILAALLRSRAEFDEIAQTLSARSTCPVIMHRH